MNNERILAHKMSMKLNFEETNSVAGGATYSSYYTANGTGTPLTGTDGCYDFNFD